MTEADFKPGDYLVLDEGNEYNLKFPLNADSLGEVRSDLTKAVSRVDSMFVVFGKPYSAGGRAWHKERFCRAAGTVSDVAPVAKSRGVALQDRVEALNAVADLDVERHRAQKLADDCGILRAELNTAYAKIGRLERQIERLDRTSPSRADPAIRSDEDNRHKRAK